MPKSTRGFASMDPERHKQIASMGGKAIPAGKRSFSQNRELAARAGRKGGMNTSPENRSFFRNRELASTSGRKGGLAVPADKRSFTDPDLASRAGTLGGTAASRRED